MREVRCPICKRFKTIGNRIALSICPSCQIIMVEVRRFCEKCGVELKDNETEVCEMCNNSKRGFGGEEKTNE